VNLRNGGFWSGVVVFAAMLAAPAPAGLSGAGWNTAAVAALMAIWWFSEAVPVAFTGALPFLLLPLLGVARADEVARGYMSPVIFLILGSTMLGIALEKWGLHRRVALAVLHRSGVAPQQLLLAIIGIAAFASMWINNSATTIMMVPIAMAITLASAPSLRSGATPLETERRFACAMALGVAWGSNIGGLGTIIGTPVNLVAAGAIERALGIQIGFAEWLMFGLPIVLLGVPLGWWVLRATIMTRPLAAADRAAVLAAVGQVEPWRPAERRTLYVLLGASAGWVAMPWLETWLRGINDAAIGLIAALALSLIPAGSTTRGERLLAWPDTLRAPWYLVLLLGGGLALADAITRTGLSQFMGEGLHAVADLPAWQLLPLIALVLILITECASNVATAATFIPVVVGLAVAGGHNAAVFAVVAGLAASWGFANPAGTSSNAMAYATGFVRMPEMLRSGFTFDLVGAALLAALVIWFVPWALAT
jgi:sodium-dependent dicarboxylate transporter 2/3/5